MSHADPIGSGHVASLARPGGNITGLSIMMTETNVKGLKLLN
jgi:putative ABC transport system substrate-binding protein